MHSIQARSGEIGPTAIGMLRAGATIRGGSGRLPVNRPVPASGRADAFTLVETLVAASIVVIGFLGAFATAVQAGRLASAAEEDALASSGLEQRIDQLRLLEWPALTDGSGLTGTVWTARPEPTAGMTVTQETLTLSPWDVAAAKTLQATWNGSSSPTVSFTAGAQNLSDASAVKAVATLTWTGRRTARPRTRTLISVISRGGISKSDLP